MNTTKEVLHVFASSLATDHAGIVEVRDINGWLLNL
jgi:hypothetical protein